MKILIVFFVLTGVACSHGPEISGHYKQMRQERTIASTGLVGWAKDKIVEVGSSNEDAVEIKLANLDRELNYVEKYASMFINTSDVNAFHEVFYVLNQFLKTYEEIWLFAGDRSRVVHADKFASVLEKSIEQVDKASFHMTINDVKPVSYLSVALVKTTEKLTEAYERLELDPSFESKYINLAQAAKQASAEIKSRKAWFFR